MAVYWLTFRISDEIIGGRDWDDRYKALMKEVYDRSGDDWWVDPTSFAVFDCNSSISTLASAFKAAIAPSKDLVLLRRMDEKAARIIGKTDDDDIFQLMPYLKKA